MNFRLKTTAIRVLLALATFGFWVAPSASADGYEIAPGQAPSAAAFASAEGAPVNIAPPLLSGSPIAGETLTASNGEWQGDPSTFSYRWLHCSNRGIRGTPFSCGPVMAANSAQYPVTELDLSEQIAVEVTATNAFGSSTARSALTTEVIAPPREHPPHILVPKAKIGAHPPKRTTSTRARFTFTADNPDDASLSFKCSLDKEPFKRCHSPFVASLKRGHHVFKVEAIGPDGARDHSPAEFRWRIS
jgi:hypothetical protein